MNTNNWHGYRIWFDAVNEGIAYGFSAKLALADFLRDHPVPMGVTVYVTAVG